LLDAIALGFQGHLDRAFPFTEVARDSMTPERVRAW
jgi:hypothetical protein